MTGPHSCLIVDDSQMIRVLAQDLMTKAGFTDIQLARDGKEAIDLLAGRLKGGKSFDIIVTDREMPKLDGIGFLRQARELLGADAPVAFMVVSSVKEPERVKEALPLGIDGYLLKPFTPEDFHKKLQQVLARKFNVA